MHTGPPDLACHEVRERVAGWLDGELGTSDAELFGRHLESCPSCAAEVARLEGQRFAPADLPDTAAPGFWDGLEAAVQRELDAVEMAGAPPTAPPDAVVRLSSRQIVALVALLLLSLSVAGIQTLRVHETRAQLSALEQALRHQQRAEATTTQALPVEPVTVAVHSPYRGSL